MIWLSIGLFVCLCLSAFFSASEMAYSSCNKLRIENLKDEQDKKGIRAFKIIEKYDDTLAAILIGNNLVNIAASSIASVMVIELFNSDDYAWAATIIVTVLVIIFGETIPKIIAKKLASTMALSFSFAIRVITIIFMPLVKFTAFLIGILTKGIETEETEDIDEVIDEKIDELSAIVESAEDEDVLDEDQSELIQAAIDFLDASALEVMTSRVDLVSIDIDDPIEQIEKTILDSEYSRIPVYKDSIDSIIGILYTNKYLKMKTDNEDIDIESILMKPCYVYKTTKLTSVLEQLRAAGQHMAIVCDEYGGTIGVVTMEDILEEIVGEIWDETDDIEEDVKELSETSFEIDGDLSISDFCELLEINEEEFPTESETVGGWALEHFETYPKRGDYFVDNDLSVRILGIEDRRITQLYVKKEDIIK